MAAQKRKADSISELQEDDIGPMKVERYDVSQETSAQSVILTPEYQKLKEGVKHVHYLITEVLKKHGGKDDSAMKLLEWFGERLLGSMSEDILVCKTGSMGSGKSSTINSLFSCGMVARSDKSGSSVTLVPHQYCGPKKDQSAPFYSEIFFFNREARERFFEGELARFYRAENQSDDQQDQELGYRRGNDADEDIDTRDTVTDALHSLFLEHKECATKRATREFLKSAGSEDDPEILEQLNKWAEKLIYRLVEDDDSIVLKASTPEEMLKQVATYTSEATDDDNQRTLSLWPLVRLVKVHFENPLSRLGVSILDAPGSSDNHIRREIALQLRRSCSHSAVVVGAARANNEGGVSKEIYAAKSKGAGRLVVIVTGSDEIDPNTLVGGNSAERQRVTELKTAVGKLENECNALMLQVGCAFDMTERAELLEKKMKLDVRHVRVQNAEKAARIAMRSENTRAKLQEKLMDITESQTPIPVVCISSTDYQKHLLGYFATQAPALSVEQTGIPELRRLFSNFPNKARTSEMRHIIKVNLPSALKRVMLFVDSNATDRKADIEDIVTRCANRPGRIIDQTLDRIKEFFISHVVAFAKSSEEFWAGRAGELCEEWKERFQTSPMLNLMNNNGLKKGTKKSGPVHMSGELIAAYNQPFVAQFDAAKKSIRSESKELVSDVISVVVDMIKDIKGDESAAFMILDPFYEYVDLEKPVLKKKITECMKGFIMSLETIKERSTTEVEDAYLVKAMLPVYAKVRLIKGGKNQTMERPKIGWAKQRHLVFKAEVTSYNGVWLDACAAMERDFAALVADTKSRLAAEVGKVFADFRSVFDSGCASPEVDEQAQKHLRQLLSARLEEANEYIKNELEPAWNIIDKGSF